MVVCRPEVLCTPETPVAQVRSRGPLPPRLFSPGPQQPIASSAAAAPESPGAAQAFPAPTPQPPAGGLPRISEKSKETPQVVPQ